MKPILFNTKMVQAIIDGRKTQTRRLVSPAHIAALSSSTRKSHPELTDQEFLFQIAAPKYRIGEILYVRETWGTFEEPGKIYYRADNDAPANIEWKPSIHMPKTAARLFLIIKEIRVERLRDITEEDARAEGAPDCFCDEEDEDDRLCQSCEKRMGARMAFAEIWDETITRKNRPSYGWHANPFIWVYKFEKIQTDKIFERVSNTLGEIVQRLPELVEQIGDAIKEQLEKSNI